MASQIIIGVLGPGETATPDQNDLAYELGKAAAQQGWTVLTGGRAFGVMDAALKGAKQHGGLTIGVLPHDARGSSSYADIKIITGMGGIRNQINILTSHVIVAIGMSSGTSSEVSLAIKADKKVILLQQDELTRNFFSKIGAHRVIETNDINETVECIKKILAVNR